MALVNVQEKWSNVNGMIEQLDGIAYNRGSAARAFTVLYDAAPRSYTPVNATGLPAIGDGFPSVSALTCVRKRAVPVGPLLYEVTCEYAGKDSPLSEPAAVSMDEYSTTEPVDKDGDGNILANTVGDLVTGLTREVSDQIYIITRNEGSRPDSTARTYNNYVNNDTWNGWTANQVRFLPLKAQRIVEGTTYYWRVTYRFHCRADGWNHRYVNEGKRYRPSAGLDPVSVRDKLGVETALLASDGTLLGGGSTVWNTEPIYPSISFAGLPTP